MRKGKFICLIVLTLLGSCQVPFPEPKPRCDVSPEMSVAGDMGITHYLSLENAKACATATDRKILVVFTGYACVSVTGMEWKQLRTHRVRKLIDEQFVVLLLYVDDKDSLAVPEFVDMGDGYDTVYTVGQRNSAREAKWGNCNSQPTYVVLDSSLNALAVEYYTKDSVAFESKLRNAIKK